MFASVQGEDRISGGLESDRGGLLAVDIADAEFDRGLCGDHDGAAARCKARIAGESRNHASDEFRALAVGQIEDAVLRGLEHTLGANSPGYSKIAAT